MENCASENFSLSLLMCYYDKSFSLLPFPFFCPTKPTVTSTFHGCCVWNNCCWLDVCGSTPDSDSGRDFVRISNKCGGRIRRQPSYKTVIYLVKLYKFIRSNATADDADVTIAVFQTPQELYIMLAGGTIESKFVSGLLRYHTPASGTLIAGICNIFSYWFFKVY